MKPESSRRKQPMCKVSVQVYYFFLIAIKFPVYCLKKDLDCNSLVVSYSKGTQSQHQNAVLPVSQQKTHWNACSSIKKCFFFSIEDTFLSLSFSAPLPRMQCFPSWNKDFEKYYYALNRTENLKYFNVKSNF